MCEEYEVDREQREEESEFLEIEVTAEDIANEAGKSTDGYEYPAEYLETLAFYRKFCEAVVEKGILLFHSSVVAVDGVAYMFTAPSGTGKSTHTALWRNVFGDKAVMINDDKPLLKVTEEGVIVYGTPWDGKHRISTNTSVPVQAICILERGQENEIRREEFFAAYPVILNQTYRPDDAGKMKKTLELVNLLMGQIPVYRMKCNISEQAACMAYNSMKYGEINER
jgi:hypothetical protein